MAKISDQDFTSISSDYIEILKTEGDKALVSCNRLNENPEFRKSISSMVHKDNGKIDYKAENILMHDMLTIFDEFAALSPGSKGLPLKAEFILIYFYEKFQGKDLLSSFDLKKLNALILSNNFQKNVELIKKTAFFRPKKELEKEFIFTALLKKINSDQTLNIAAILQRVATIIVKADNKISKKEEEWLSQLSDKLSHPKVIVEHARYNEIPAGDNLDAVMAELHGFIGLKNIKDSVLDLTNFLKVQKMRKEKDLKTNA